MSVCSACCSVRSLRAISISSTCAQRAWITWVSALCVWMHAPAIHTAWHGLVRAAGTHAVGKPSTVTCRAETLTSRICSCEKQTCDRRGEPCCTHGALLLLAARKGAWRSARRLAAPAASDATLPCSCMASSSRLLRVGQFHRGWKVGVGVGSWNRRTRFYSACCVPACSGLCLRFYRQGK